MTAFSDKTGLGGVILQKIAGQTAAGPALGTLIHLPVNDASSDNPDNNAYAAVANGLAGPVGVVKGKHTPSMPLIVDAHSSWFKYLNLNDWIGGAKNYLDANYDTSQYAANRTEPVLGDVIFTGGKCQSIQIIYNAQGGFIKVLMGWPFIYGDNEDPSPPAFSAYVPVTGQYYNTSDVNITGFDQDRSFILTLFRAQAYQWNNTQTLYAQAITSHSFAGSLAIEQSPTYSTTPSTNCTIQIGPAGTGIKFVCQVNRDGQKRTFPGASPGSRIVAYSIADILNVNAGGNSAGYGVVISAGS